jgi:hypothetical protein
VFEGPVAATGKNRQLSRTESEKTEPLFAVVCGLKPVAVAVFPIFTYLKTACNRLEPVATDYGLSICIYMLYLMYIECFR